MAPLRTTVLFCMHLYITPSNRNHLIPLAFGPYGFSPEDQNRMWRWKPVDFEFFLLAWILSCIYSDFSCPIGFLKGIFFFPPFQRSEQYRLFFFLSKRSFYFLFFYVFFFQQLWSVAISMMSCTHRKTATSSSTDGQRVGLYIKVLHATGWRFLMM